MILVQIADFVGFYTLAKSVQNNTLLQKYIDDNEAAFIKQILGATLGQEFITDKSNPTQDPIYAVIEQPFTLDNGGEIVVSKGMKDALTALIFYKFIIDSQTRHAQAGVTLNQAEVSTINSPENAARYGEVRWNAALTTIEAIQWYVTTYQSGDYPDYNGQKFTPEYSAFL